MIDAVDIHVKGIVQGVGFRPFVYRMAKKYLINGWVLNAADGVYIHAEGESKLVDEFIMELSDNAPAASKVEEIDIKEVPLEDFDSFEIRFSDDDAVEETTLVSPDLATCEDCAAELFNPNDRRYRYPFINCTNCGPRFTIIDHLPYDRAATSMAAFPMCEKCAAEYADPLDRRFHAQPDACFECGPSVTWRVGSNGEELVGKTREESDAIFAAAVEMLMAGKILAVKGLGGFHLVCDANNAEAVAELRRRKRRDGKALAVMAQAMGDVQALCHAGEEEEAVLTGSARPIVLLRKRADGAIGAGVADGLSELGVMLPYTPVQHLLMHDFAQAWYAANPQVAEAGDEPGRRVPLLVMTSGNVHDEPICIADEEAREKLSDIADAFLGNNRPILTRFDDSVVRLVQVGTQGGLKAAPTDGGDAVSPSSAPDSHPVMGPSPVGDGLSRPAAVDARQSDTLVGEKPAYAVQFLRRARGFAPVPLSVAAASEGSAEGKAAEGAVSVAADGVQPKAGVIFAAGPEQKNTFTLLRGTDGFVSQHIGDVENADTYDAWLATKDRFESLFEMEPAAVACDLHPEYLTSKWAHHQALPVTEVQHHHAHIVSVMAEHGLTDAVCGIAFDGTGYGVDGAIWGGEVLLANRSNFERFANFAYVPMPGGAAAIKHPLRMAYGVLWAYDLLDHPAAEAALAPLGEEAEVCDTMIERGLNTPMTSSVGRLFDAASALLGVCTTPSYEGEGAILLEAAMEVAGADAPGAAVAEEAAGVAGEDELAARERYAVTAQKNVATETSTAEDTSVLLLDAEPTFRALLDDLEAGVPVSVIARRFHDAMVSAIVMAAELVRALYGISTVVLSGGVFMNRYLLERTLPALAGAGFTAAINRDLPPNDGCISLGQAVVCSARPAGRAD
ncbi:carbamoyltransferase HypF [Adlercreutzia sp. R21]|uniref:carbamoyltransferase HypF n=1 Tax=Adlercreutzia wanghongyangiae TaxID=3111451 RepID=UPI002DB8AE38|nr:carbamoyltransferase HypF [Adlercreutzia sp. R21]MEC4185321.1 carbamoyltransferase HypF [Adlercreutzia sp. R21]